MSLFQRDLLSTQDWDLSEITQLLDLAEVMRRDRHKPEHREILSGRTFFLLFFSESLRTRLSFAAAISELGGQATEMSPQAARLGSGEGWKESIEDVARVIGSYGAGIGIRTDDGISTDFGQGAAFVREFASHTSMPVVSMGDDNFHPCQGLADLAGLRNTLGPALKGKRILVSWAPSVLARSRSSTQAVLLAASRAGMEVTLAHPEGYELDGEVFSQIEKNCAASGSTLRVTHDSDEAYAGQHVVYARNWVSRDAYRDGRYHREQEIQRSMDTRRASWRCTADKMNTTEDAFFLNPMPVDRSREVTDEVASGPRSMIYAVAENRLHVQKAYIALTTGWRPESESE